MAAPSTLHCSNKPFMYRTVRRGLQAAHCCMSGYRDDLTLELDARHCRHGSTHLPGEFTAVNRGVNSKYYCGRRPQYTGLQISCRGPHREVLGAQAAESMYYGSVILWPLHAPGQPTCWGHVHVLQDACAQVRLTSPRLLSLCHGMARTKPLSCSNLLAEVEYTGQMCILSSGTGIQATQYILSNPAHA